MSNILSTHGIHITNGNVRWNGMSVDLASVEAIERRTQNSPLNPWLYAAMAICAFLLWATYYQAEVLHTAIAATYLTQKIAAAGLVIAAAVRFYIPSRQLVLMFTTVRSYLLIDTTDPQLADALAQDLEQQVNAAKRAES